MPRPFTVAFVLSVLAICLGHMPSPTLAGEQERHPDTDAAIEVARTAASLLIAGRADEAIDAHWDMNGFCRIIFGDALDQYAEWDREQINSQVSFIVKKLEREAPAGFFERMSLDESLAKPMAADVVAVRCAVHVRDGASTHMTFILQKQPDGQWRVVNHGAAGQMLGAMFKVNYEKSGLQPALFAQQSFSRFNKPYDVSAAQAVRPQLQLVRVQLELYAMQHDPRWPTLAQLNDNWRVLTQTTDRRGNIAAKGRATYGPYLTAIPVNPLTGSSKVVPMGSPTPDAGWTYNEQTGRFYAVVPAEAREMFTDVDAEFLPELVTSAR